jgi:cell division protein FtsQ
MKLKKIKFPKINWKQVGLVSAWCFSIAGLFVTLGFVEEEKSAVKCNTININISDENGNEFIKRNDILDLLNSKGKQPIGKQMHDINIAMLEKLVNSNPYVANAEVFSTINGELNIDIYQRNPVIRIINNKDEHFYIDDRGEFMPVSSNYTAPVIVANGFISDTYTERKVKLIDKNVLDTMTIKPVINELFEMAQFIRNDQFWNAQIEQIYINEQSEIELIPRVGNQRIIFGDASSLEEKFTKLMIFYKEGLNKTGWNNYTVINLKFTNQVVCTKPVAETNTTIKTTNSTQNQDGKH